MFTRVLVRVIFVCCNIAFLMLVHQYIFFILFIYFLPTMNVDCFHMIRACTCKLTSRSHKSHAHPARGWMTVSSIYRDSDGPRTRHAGEREKAVVGTDQ
jgi:hypothetical protein